MERQRSGENKEKLVAAIYNQSLAILRDYGETIHSDTGKTAGVKTVFHDTKDIRGFSNIRFATPGPKEPITVILIRQYKDSEGNVKALRREITLSSDGKTTGIRVFDRGMRVSDDTYVYPNSFLKQRINLINLDGWVKDAGNELGKAKPRKEALSPDIQRERHIIRARNILIAARREKERKMWEKERRRKKIR